MISVADLDNIALARLDDAKALLAAERFDGASADLSHAELARVSKWRRRVSCLPQLPGSRAVAVWKVKLRYNAIGTTRQRDATAMIQATDRLWAVL